MAVRNREIAYALRVRNASRNDIRAFVGQIRQMTQQVRTQINSLNRTRNPLAGMMRQMQTGMRDTAKAAGTMATNINRSNARMSQSAGATTRSIGTSNKTMVQNAQASAQQVVASHNQIVTSYNRMRAALARPVSNARTPVTPNGAAPPVPPARRPTQQSRSSGDASFAAQLAPIVNVASMALATRQLIEYADTWTLASNKIAAAGTPMSDVKNRMRDLADIARESRNALDDVAGTFARLTIASKDIGASQSQVLRVTETMSKAMTVTGASTQEAQAAMIQFSQALASGVLQGDELRSLRENAPIVAQAIAKEFGTTIGQLKKLGSEGKLTADRVFKAILSAGDDIDAAFAKTTPSIMQSIRNISTTMSQLIGEFDKANGVTVTITSYIDRLSSAMLRGEPAVMAVATAVGILTTALAAASAVSLIAQLVAFSGLAGPIGLVVVAVAAVVSGLVLAKDQMVQFGNSSVSVSSLVQGAWTVTKEVLVEVWEAAKSAFDTFWQSVQGINDWLREWQDGQVRSARQSQDTWIALWRSFEDGWGNLLNFINTVMAQIKGGIVDGFINAFKEAGDYIQSWVQTFADMLNPLVQGFGALTGKTFAPIAAPDLFSGGERSNATQDYLITAERENRLRQEGIDKARLHADVLREIGRAEEDRLRNQTWGEMLLSTEIGKRIAKYAQLAEMDKSEMARRNAAAEMERQRQQSANLDQPLKTPETTDDKAAKERESQLKQLAEGVRAYNHEMQTERMMLGLVGDEADRVSKVMAYKAQLDQMDKLSVEERNAALAQYDTQLRQHIGTMNQYKTAQNGMIAGAREYALEAGNSFENAKTFMTNSLSSLEDTLTNFFATGQMGFKEMIQAMIADFMRLFIIRPLLAQLAGAFGLGPQTLGSTLIPQVTAAAPAVVANAVNPGANVTAPVSAIAALRNDPSLANRVSSVTNAASLTTSQMASKTDIVADVLAAKQASTNVATTSGWTPNGLKFEQNVDPKMQAWLNDAALKYEASTNYDVRNISGYRPGDPRFHGKGMAQDIALYDRTTGAKLDNYQDPATFRAYEQYAQQVRTSQMAMNPENADSLRWGGYFSGPPGKYGAMDTMHFDRYKTSVMGGGSWENGLNSTQKAYFPGAQSQGMNDIAPTVKDFQANPQVMQQTQQLQQLNQNAVRQTQQMVTSSSQQLAQATQQTAQLTQQTTLGQQQITATQAVATAQKTAQATPAAIPGADAAAAMPTGGLMSGMQNMFSGLFGGLQSMLQGLMGGLGGMGQGIMSIFGGLFGGFHNGGIVGEAGRSGGNIKRHAQALTFAKYHSGGIVGQPKLKSGERNITAKDGEAVMPTVRLPDGSFGVKAVGASGGGRGGNFTFAPSTSVQVNGAGGSKEDQQRMGDEIAKRVNDLMDVKMNEFMAQQQRSGGMLKRNGF